MSKVVIVTGGTSGIGLAAAERFLASGCTVYEFSRREAGAPNASRHIPVDITDEDGVTEAVKSVFDAEGRIDVLVNNAGFGISGAVEFTDSADARRQVDVNLMGMSNVTKAVIPYMRKAGGGRIVNLSSVAGAIAIPFQAWYSVSKAAINAYTMALSGEVAPFGITVCAVLPGDIKTGFTSARKKSAAGDDVYSGRIDRSVSRMEKDEQGGMSPDAAAKVICRVALKKRVKPFYSVGLMYKFFLVLAKLLPASAVRRIVYLMYAK